MSQAWVSKVVWMIVQADLTPEARVLWAYLAYRQADNATCWPALDRIAKDLHLSVWKTREAIRELITKGLLRREQPKTGRGHITRYAVVGKGSEIQTLSGEKGSENQHGKGLDFQQSEGVYKEEDYLIKRKPKRVVVCSSDLEQFEGARRLYPGTKRGRDTEFGDFRRKHKDWPAVLPELQPAIRAQIRHRQTLAEALQFVPAWKNFRTWLYQRCWEEQVPTPAGIGDLDGMGMSEEEAEAFEREHGWPSTPQKEVAV